MVATRDISEGDQAEVEAQDLASYVLASNRAAPRVVAAETGTEYVVDYVRRRLVRDYGEQATFGGGLRVTTNIDMGAQRAAYNAVYGTLNRSGDPAGALVAIDNEGRVRALVGGKDFEESNVNLAVGRDGGGKGRQPGSTFKPFLLAEIVHEGYTLESAFPAPAEIVLPKADNGKDWHVGNYAGESFGGNLNLVEATRNSVNTVYAQAETVIGPEKLMQQAQRLGHHRAAASGRVVWCSAPSRCRRSTSRRRIRLGADAANASRRSSSSKIETADGKVLYQADPERQRVLAPNRPTS